MEPEQVFVAIPSTPIQSPPPRKKPGRKPLGLSTEDRVRMNREAQRLSRERKNKRLAAAEEENEALRLRVQQLEAQLTSHSEPTSAYCRNCEFNHHRITMLEQQLATRYHGGVRSPPRHSFTPSNTATLRNYPASISITEESDWKDVSLNSYDPGSPLEIYGPIDTETTRLALNSLPSIQGNPNIDTMIHLFVVQAGTNDPRLTIKCLLGIINARYKLLDSCTIIERQKAVEIMDEFTQGNCMHTIKFHELIAHKPSPLSTTPYATVISYLNNPRVKPFRDSLRAIPSLQHANDMIDELCLLFWSCNVGDTDTSENLLRVALQFKRLESLCTVDDDRVRFNLAIEVARAGNRAQMDELLRYDA